MLACRRIMHFLPWYLGRIPNLYLGTFPGVPAGYFLQRNGWTNYLYKGLRPWMILGSIEEPPSGWAIPPCAR